MFSIKVYEGKYYANKGNLRVADYILVIYFFNIPIKSTYFESIDDWTYETIFQKFTLIKNKHN